MTKRTTMEISNSPSPPSYLASIHIYLPRGLQEPTTQIPVPSGSSSAPQAEVYAEPDSQMDDDYWEEDANEDKFVDQGEGAGVEGDLEMDEG